MRVHSPPRPGAGRSVRRARARPSTGSAPTGGTVGPPKRGRQTRGPGPGKRWAGSRAVHRVPASAGRSRVGSSGPVDHRHAGRRRRFWCPQRARRDPQPAHRDAVWPSMIRPRPAVRTAAGRPPTSPGRPLPDGSRPGPVGRWRPSRRYARPPAQLHLREDPTARTPREALCVRLSRARSSSERPTPELPTPPSATPVARSSWAGRIRPGAAPRARETRRTAQPVSEQAQVTAPVSARTLMSARTPAPAGAPMSARALISAPALICEQA